MAIGWTEETVRQKTELSLQDGTYQATREERERDNQNWTMVRNTDGTTESGMNTDHPDYRAAIGERKHVAAECLYTFSSTTLAAAASAAAAALMAGMVAK